MLLCRRQSSVQRCVGLDGWDGKRKGEGKEGVRHASVTCAAYGNKRALAALACSVCCCQHTHIAHLMDD